MSRNWNGHPYKLQVRTHVHFNSIQFILIVCTAYYLIIYFCCIMTFILMIMIMRLSISTTSITILTITPTLILSSIWQHWNCSTIVLKFPWLRWETIYVSFSSSQPSLLDCRYSNVLTLSKYLHCCECICFVYLFVC